MREHLVFEPRHCRQTLLSVPVEHRLVFPIGRRFPSSSPLGSRGPASAHKFVSPFGYQHVVLVFGKQDSRVEWIMHEPVEDPSKRNAGLFFFRGKPGAPFAIVAPGGGFRLCWGRPRRLSLCRPDQQSGV